MRRAVVLVAVVGLGLAGCSSGSSKPTAVPTHAAGVAGATTAPAAPTSTQPAVPAETCATPLPDRGDVIEWQREPGVADSAVELGGTDPEHCVLTFDTLQASSPTGVGYCTEAAWASDNPGYNADATPAPPLKKVQVKIGDCS